MNMTDSILTQMQQMMTNTAFSVTGQETKQNGTSDFKNLVKQKQQSENNAVKPETDSKQSETVQSEEQVSEQEQVCVAEKEDSQTVTSSSSKRTPVKTEKDTHSEVNIGMTGYIPMDLFFVNREVVAAEEIVSPEIFQSVSELSDKAPILSAASEFELSAEAVTETPVFVTEMEVEEVLPSDFMTEAFSLEAESLEVAEIKPESFTEQQTDDDFEVVSSENPVGDQPLFRNVEHTPVKVAEPERIDTKTADLDTETAQIISRAEKNGDSRVEIQLMPENLGKVTVELTQKENGSLHIMIQASTEKAAKLFSNHTDQITRLLQADYHSVQVEVRKTDESSQTNQQNYDQADPDGRSGQNPQQEQAKHQKSSSNRDFIDRLRLGLAGVEKAV